MEHSYVEIDGNSIICIPEKTSTAVKHTVEMIKRDHQKVFGKQPLLETSFVENADIVIRYSETDEECPPKPEAYSYRFKENNGKWSFHIIGYDDLGIIYGLLEYSRQYLEVDPFWFWADISVKQKANIHIPILNFDSVEKAVKYRGWFVNDEVCLIGWKDEYPPTKEVWHPVYEALLRCGGNMVIPGTDLPRNGIHAELALEMGLWVTHHHAEPLGAEMFKRAFPEKKPSYKEHQELFETLWKDAIQKQKNDKIVWVLSFRGQGDAPFWQNDSDFDTSEKRGMMISKVVRRQYEMVCESVEEPVCAMPLYGEIAELYKAGFIEVPEGVIKIWADNGYGKMVSRRQENENSRVPALPASADKGKHGIYYHITFHDLQASNHLTMFPSSPELITEEVERAINVGASSYLLLNSGNIRPHLYPLDLVKEIWTKGQVNPEEHLQAFITRLYTSKTREISELYKTYFDKTILYGPNSDDRAGEQFYHHNARRIIGHWLQGKTNTPEPKLFWATGEIPFSEQVSWFKEKCESAVFGWEQLLQRSKELSMELTEEDQIRFNDQFLIHVELHASGCKGFIALCQAYLSYLSEKFAIAFVQLYQSINEYKYGYHALKKAEHGKWKNFYRADWLTNIEATLYSLDTARKFIRMHGDSPHFFLWYKEYLMPETEKHIYLENTHRKPLSDDELAKRLEEKFFS